MLDIEGDVSKKHDREIIKQAVKMEAINTFSEANKSLFGKFLTLIEERVSKRIGDEG